MKTKLHFVYYEVEDYNKIQQGNSRTNYKKQKYQTLKEINMKAKSIAENYKLTDKVEQYQETKAFITIKDHKANILNNLKCKLINHVKSNLGKVSSQFLNQIKHTVREIWTFTMVKHNCSNNIV